MVRPTGFEPVTYGLEVRFFTFTSRHTTSHIFDIPVFVNYYASHHVTLLPPKGCTEVVQEKYKYEQVGLGWQIWIEVSGT
jgi:hypothetical protein